MGYTHYWRLKAATLSTEALVIIGELLGRAYHRGIIQREFDDPRPPFVSDTKIRFNGVGESGHETFYFTSTPDTGQSNTGWTFHFCKTARKPYDRVVMQVLIVLKYYLGKAITVSSDGDFTVEWAAARRELEHRYGIRTVSGQQLERVAA
ncbi:MAG TPA: hypothetical protein VFF53_11600 [Geobacteraceae bacterium]|nr:hypothetical protein [Geobacteraceae bacterium]